MPNLTYKFIIHDNIIEKSGNDANTELIRCAVDQFNWQKAFLNKNVNEKVKFLMKQF